MKNIAAQWFHAVETLGDDLGIRYGRIPNDTGKVEWHFISHCECDGIGGFTRLLRKSGATISPPLTNYSTRQILTPLLNFWKKKANPSPLTHRRHWTPEKNDPPRPHSGPPQAVAWHLFSENQTSEILEKCHQQKTTVNTHLLYHLNQAILPDIPVTNARIPWMIPVNLRGDIQMMDETHNHVSFIQAEIGAEDSSQSLQHQIFHRLQQGEHRAKYLFYKLGRFLSHRMKVKAIEYDRKNWKGNIGAFSNLGAWDEARKIPTKNSWLFCPPVVTGQLLGAGCVTFQNRLSLTLQAHPNHSQDPKTAQSWLDRWVSFI